MTSLSICVNIVAPGINMSFKMSTKNNIIKTKLTGALRFSGTFIPLHSKKDLKDSSEKEKTITSNNQKLFSDTIKEVSETETSNQTG